MAKRRDESWLEDYSFILTPKVLTRLRNDFKFETFQGSKVSAGLWLTVLAAWAGALGSVLVSGALWRVWLLVLLWPIVAIASWWLGRRATLALSGSFLAFVAGHCMFWGVLIGIVAMWGAQLSSAGWAYGIAGGFGFLLGVVHGNYEPEDLESAKGVSSIGYLSGPVGACAAAYMHRNLLGDPDGLVPAAVTGAIAALILLTPWIATFLAKLNNAQGLARLASLLLHRDDTAPDAVRLLGQAIRLRPDDPSFLSRRGLACALTGQDENARADWERVRELAPNNNAPDLARGWVALRLGRYDEAAEAFQKAMPPKGGDYWALVGLAVTRLRQGAAAAALRALKSVPGRSHDELSLTYLAEAYLLTGDPAMALSTATDAIDEADSTHGRSWLVRAEAHRALGDVAAAAADYNKALWAADEEGVEQRALAGLQAIDRPVSQDEPEW